MSLLQLDAAVELVESALRLKPFQKDIGSEAPRSESPNGEAPSCFGVLRRAGAASLAVVVLLSTSPGWASTASMPAEFRDVAIASLKAEFRSRSFPSDLSRVSLENPWGERIVQLDGVPENWGLRIVAAASMYADQKIRFDGYMGSDDDGRHYATAADGEDGAYYGNPEKRSYRCVKNGVVDDLNERVWICLDLFMHSCTMAGFPIRKAMTDDYRRATAVYTIGGTFAENEPRAPQYFRRVRNVQIYFERRQFYSEQRISTEQYRDPDFRPVVPFQPGDLLFFGHYGDEDGEKGWWRAQHTGIVDTVDSRGLPVQIFDMRVSQGLEDTYDGEINQTRTVAGKKVFFKRFSDRYSMIGFGRIVNRAGDAIAAPTTRPGNPRTASE